MISSAQLTQLSQNLQGLGAKKLMALSLIGVVVLTGIGVSAYFLSRPAMQTLYSGLSTQDVGRMVNVLAQSGIQFDVNDQGNTIFVPRGQTARARMQLAEKGLPSGSNAGYELFDNLGSMGLTSFMQEVTRIRALEGEIARSIQTMSGVKAARVHLVMADPGSFRRKSRDPSASVVLSMDGVSEYTSVQAVRHLVAAAVPGMKLEQISILSTDGSVLAAAGDANGQVPQKMMGLEKKISEELRQNASKTLAPYLGLGNYQVSVAVRLNTDQRQINETSYDPESRVERSVRVVKETGASQNKSANGAVSVEQNLPDEEGADGGGEQSSKKEERREELTNYEMNSKSVQTVSQGYRIERLAIAVVLNKEQLGEGVGEDQAALTQKLEEIKRVVAAATGVNGERGDTLEISAVNFQSKIDSLAPAPSLGVMDHIMGNLGTMINASALLVLVFAVIWFGLRPATKILAEAAPQVQAQESQSILEDASPADAVSGDLALEQMAPDGGLLPMSDGVDVPEDMPFAMADLSEQLAAVSDEPGDSPKDRLQDLIDKNEEQVVSVLKQWLREEVPST